MEKIENKTQEIQEQTSQSDFDNSTDGSGSEIKEKSKFRVGFDRFTARHGEIWKFIKFSFTGLSTTVLQMLVDAFFLYVVFRSLSNVSVENKFLIWLGIGDKMAEAYAYLIAATVGYIASFIMNRKMTFHSKTKLTWSSVAYVVMVIATILITTWMKAFFASLLAGHGLTGPLWNTILDVVVILIPFVWTYPLQRFVIMKPSKDSEESTDEDSAKASENESETKTED